jgi:hypothetical protein
MHREERKEKREERQENGRAAGGRGVHFLLFSPFSFLLSLSFLRSPAL